MVKSLQPGWLMPIMKIDHSCSHHGEMSLEMDHIQVLSEFKYQPSVFVSTASDDSNEPAGVTAVDSGQAATSVSRMLPIVSSRLIRKINTSGEVSTVAGSEALVMFSGPSDVMVQGPMHHAMIHTAFVWVGPHGQDVYVADG